MKMRMLLASVTLSFAGTIVAAAPPVALVNDGRPACAIVIAKDARKSARFGAFELQWHIKKMTGVEIPIVSATEAVHGIPVYVGESDALKDVIGSALEGFKTQEYVVSVQPDRIILAGEDADDKGACTYNMDDPLKMSGLPDMWTSNGSLYAVYDFLERSCGVRWFNQTESGTFIPETKTLSVPCGELRRRPAFIYRNVSPAYGPSGYDSYVSLWKRDTPQLKQWDALAYAGLHEKYPDAGQYNAAKGNLSYLFLLRSRDGGDRMNCNHSLYGYYDRFWENGPTWPGRAAFVERRPNYFAKGYPQDAKPPQLCYTDPGLIQQVAQDAADYYDGKKSGKELELPWVILPNPFPVEPMDNSTFCKCENCAKFFKKPKEPEGVYYTGADSDYFFNFVNKVCKELHKTHPDKGVISLAYISHARVPSFQLDPGVNIQYCFGFNRSPYDLLQYNNDLANLAGWVAEKKVSGRPLGLWLYYTFPVEIANNANQHCFPGFFAHTIDKQMKLFDKYGIYGFTHCGYGQEVEAYVTFRLMNDPSLDVDELLDEYFRDLYGNAAPPMKELYSRIEETYSNPENYVQKGDADSKHSIGQQSMMQISWGMLGTKERMAEFGRLMEAAEKLAQTDIEKRRVALFKKAVWEYMTTGAAEYQEMTKAPIPSIAVPEIPDARGDAKAVDWSKAIALGGTWFEAGGDKPSSRKLSGRICHDGKFLYMELSDDCDTAKLVTSASVSPYDDWEVFVAGQRGLPYRQFMIGPTGQVVPLSDGEVNWRMDVPITDTGIQTASDVSATRWVTRLAIPLASLTAKGIAADGKFYLNVARVTSPQMLGRTGLEVDTWVSFTRVHEVQRLAEITLAR